MPVVRVRVLCAAEHRDVVRAVGEGAPHLVAVDHPVVAVPARAAADVRKVGAGFRLGEGDRAEELAADDARHVLRPLLGVPAGAARPRDDARDAHPAAGQLLGDEAVLEDAETEAAVLLGDADREVAEVGHLRAERGDVALHLVQLVRDREDLLHRELARRLLDHQPLFCQVGHGRFSPHCPSVPRPRHPRGSSRRPSRRS